MSGRLVFFSVCAGSGLVVVWILWALASGLLGLVWDREPTVSEGSTNVPIYVRDAFGNWLDEDGDCLDTRQEILVALSLTAPTVDESGCRIVGGSWRDEYTGEVLSDPRRIDVDHVVPLYYAWMSGASGWTEDKANRFYNDPRNLALTSASVNRSKGDQSPVDWLPPDPRYQCDYLYRFLWVVESYGLTPPSRERDFFSDLKFRICD